MLANEKHSSLSVSGVMVYEKSFIMMTTGRCQPTNEAKTTLCFRISRFLLGIFNIFGTFNVLGTFFHVRNFKMLVILVLLTINCWELLNTGNLKILGKP